MFFVVNGVIIIRLDYLLFRQGKQGETNYELNSKVIKSVQTHAGRKVRSSETLPAEGIGCIPVTRGHREGFGDCAECH